MVYYACALMTSVLAEMRNANENFLKGSYRARNVLCNVLVCLVLHRRHKKHTPRTRTRSLSAASTMTS
jgi:hypothetical protein